MFPLAEPRRWRAVPTSWHCRAGRCRDCWLHLRRFPLQRQSAGQSLRAVRSAAPAQDVTGAVSHPPPPASRVETQPLPPPPQASAEGGSTANSAPGRADITGSVHPTAAAPARSTWNWEGGTAITVGHGDTIEQISQALRRTGLGHHAGEQHHGAGLDPARPAPRHSPAITTTAASRIRARLRPRVAANATMVPVGATKPQAALPAAPPHAGNGVHVVAPGDSLISIARRYHKPRKAIAKANNLAPDARIRVGQRLTIPDMKPAAPASAAPVANPTAKSPRRAGTPAHRRRGPRSQASGGAASGCRSTQHQSGRRQRRRQHPCGSARRGAQRGRSCWYGVG